MVPITQICKFSVISLIVFSFFNTTFAKDTLFNDYGNYLEWTYAKETKDTKKLKKTFKKINLSNLREDTLEELLFESIIFDDWGNGKKISLKLIDINKGNITANLFLMVENFLENKKINADFFSNDTKQILDANFLEAIFIWIGKNEQLNYTKKLEDCIPLLCAHYGMNLMLNGNKKKAQKFFQKIENKNFSSSRIKELQVYAYLKVNNKNKVKEVLEKLSYKDLNLKNYDIRNISINLRF